jgi:hypothetical protein
LYGRGLYELSSANFHLRLLIVCREFTRPYGRISCQGTLMTLISLLGLATIRFK